MALPTCISSFDGVHCKRDACFFYKQIHALRADKVDARRTYTHESSIPRFAQVLGDRRTVKTYTVISRVVEYLRTVVMWLREVRADFYDYLLYKLVIYKVACSEART